MGRTYVLNAPDGTAAVFRRRLPQVPAGPLSNTQKARLCQLAAKSHNLDGPLSAEEHRHAECQAAVGKPGLTACTQADYKALEAHFLNLAGETGAAYTAAVAHGTQDVRVAMHKLAEACGEAGKPLAYAAAIARKRWHGAQLSELNAKQLWQLTFTLNHRGSNAKRTARRR